MTGVGDGSRGHISGRLWFAIGFFLAAGATFALVFTDDLRWLRLGILAALWAALVGSFVAMRYRRQMAAKESAAERAQEIYELELEREIAARREFEWEVEAQTRQRIEENSREEIEALRAEVMALRENLQALFDGEVLWERVALTAQSTRMRSLAEEPRLAAGEASSSVRPQIPLNVAASEVVEQPTELIDRVGDHEAAAAPSAPPESPAASAEPAQHVQRSARRVTPGYGGEAARTKSGAGAGRVRAERSTGTPAERSRDVSRTGQQLTDRPVDHTESTTAGRTRSERRSRSRAARPSEPPYAPRREQDPGSVPPRSPRSPAHGQQPTESTQPAMDGVPRGRPASAVTPPIREAAVQPPPFDTGQSPVFAESFEDDWTANPEPSVKATELPHTPISAVLRARGQEPGAAEQTSLSEPVSLPPQFRGGTGRPGRHSRHADSERGLAGPESTPDAADRPGIDDGSSWREPTDEPVDGSRERKTGTSGPPPATGRRRAARVAAESSGSSGAHSTGRSVSELLAAYGMSTSTPRRRRRAED